MKLEKNAENFTVVIIVFLTLLISLTSAAGKQLSGEAEVLGENSNAPPIADADGPYETIENEEIQLDGTESEDPDGNPITYLWKISDDPTGKAVLKNPKQPRPNFITPSVNSIIRVTVTLTVEDNYELTDENETTVKIKNENKEKEFELSELKITPETANPGETVYITAELKNSGEKQENYKIYLYIDNKLENVKTYNLKPGETLKIKFETSRVDEKTYTVKLNHMLGTFTVKKPNKLRNIIIAITIFTVVGIIIAAFWWIMQNRTRK